MVKEAVRFLKKAAMTGQRPLNPSQDAERRKQREAHEKERS